MDTLKSAGKNTFKVYKFGAYAVRIVVVAEILGHPNFSEKNTIAMHPLFLTEAQWFLRNCWVDYWVIPTM